MEVATNLHNFVLIGFQEANLFGLPLPAMKGVSSASAPKKMLEPHPLGKNLTCLGKLY